MPLIDVPYDELPRLVKDNLTAEQWRLAQDYVVPEGAWIPESAYYVNLKNGQQHRYQAGERAEAPLLPAHDLAGGHGKSDEQFHGAPPGAPVP